MGSIEYELDSWGPASYWGSGRVRKLKGILRGVEPTCKQATDFLARQTAPRQQSDSSSTEGFEGITEWSQGPRGQFERSWISGYCLSRNGFYIAPSPS